MIRRFVYGITVFEDGSLDIMNVNTGVPEDLVFRQMRAHLRTADDDYAADYRRKNRR